MSSPDRPDELAPARARLARATRAYRSHPDDDRVLASLANARRTYTELKLRGEISHALDQWPPLTTEQRRGLSELLVGDAT